jgi:hypothetical protein
MSADESGKNVERPCESGLEAGVHESPIAALRDVCSAYDDWSKGLTDSSLQMCFALVAANWLVFGSVAGIRQHGWAMASLFLVLAALAFNLLGAYSMAEWFRRRVEYAEADGARWKSEFVRYSNIRHPWPYTRNVEVASKVLRFLKMALPLVSGVGLIVAALGA